MVNAELKVYISSINVYVASFYGDIFLDNTDQIEIYNIDEQKLLLCNSFMWLNIVREWFIPIDY
jgi:hypothetical protein